MTFLILIAILTGTILIQSAVNNSKVIDESRKWLTL